MSRIAGIGVGGSFTDRMLSGATGEERLAKVPTTILRLGYLIVTV